MKPEVGSISGTVVEFAPGELEAADVSIDAGDGDPGDNGIPRSPLWLLTRDPTINELIGYLEKKRLAISEDPNGDHQLLFSRSELIKVRTAFRELILSGESRLHKLSELLSSRLFGQFSLQSVVIGELPASHERFTLSQTISPADLYSTTDLDLGNRQLKRLEFSDNDKRERAVLVANMVEYLPSELSTFNIFRLISRIKAEEEVFNKLADEIFQLDSLVRRDKKLWGLSRFVKDVFGLKFVVGQLSDVVNLQEAFEKLVFTPDELSRFGVPLSPETERLSIIEVKDYLGKSERKKSGWEAIKSVVSWYDKLFEIQIQPLRNFHREREFLTAQSHAGFKTRRETIRNSVASQIPLFKFYRDLLQWLFREAVGGAPEFPGVRVTVVD